MPRPKFPPNNWNILIPASLLYDKGLPDAVKVTWAQLRGMTMGGSETLPFSAPEFYEATGTKEKTLYGHLRVLRDRHALIWRRGSGSTFIVAFECQLPEPDCPPEILEIENSGNPDNPIILDQADQSLKAKEDGVSGNREFSKSRKPDAPGKTHRNDGLFEAVAVATKRAPPENDWSLMPPVTRGILNKVSGELRKVKATPEQIRGFPVWFEAQKKGNYKLRRPIEPWDLPKMWTQYLGDQHGSTTGTASGHSNAPKPTPEQLSAADRINAMRAAKQHA